MTKEERERKWTGKLKETEGKKMAGGEWGPGGGGRGTVFTDI